MNSTEQLKALQQILDTLNIAASRQSDIDYKKDGNRHFTTAIQNTKKLMKGLELEQIGSLNLEAKDFSDLYGHSLGLSNI
jgi:coenzyme F420-reducing hydrogenase delta subunit